MYCIPYGKTYLEFSLPPGMQGTVVESRPVGSLAARELRPDLDVLIVPHALLTLPVVAR